MFQRRLAASRGFALLVILAGCSGDDGGDDTLTVTWKFESGDCAANNVDKVRVTLTPPGGQGSPKEFVCSAGAGDVGKISAGGSYGISGEGLDASGKPRFVSTASASFPQGKVLAPLEITLRPKPSRVTVTWNGCPPGVVLPYAVGIYRPPATGTTPTDEVTETQASCQASRATLDGVPPGTYVAVVDSRAVTPAVRGMQNVTVVAGEDVEVNVPVP